METSGNGRPRVCFKVVPVKVSGPSNNKQITTYVFLGSGSDSTLCLRGLLEELDLESEPADFTLTTVNYEGRECSHRACLEIESLDGKTRFTLVEVLTT